MNQYTSKANRAIKDYIDNGKVYADLENGVIRHSKGKRAGSIMYIDPCGRRGRLRVGLRDPETNKPIKVCISRIVAYSVFGDIVFDPALEVDHINGDFLNNAAYNLQLLPAPDNTSKKNKRFPFSVWRNDEVVAICKSYEDAKIISQVNGGKIKGTQPTG